MQHYPISRANLYQNVASETGAIISRVLDANGQPVFEAEVYADKTDAPMGRRPFVYTDKQGHFLIKGLTPGTYTVSAAKEKDYYPATDSPFYSATLAHAPQVSVYGQQTTSDIVINIGSKAARLTGRVIDSATKKPVKRTVQLTLARADHLDYSLSTAADLVGRTLSSIRQR